MCGGQEAYPVYITIGNISKVIRRKANMCATVLLGYLPVDTFAHVTNKPERARLTHELTHRAMEILMEPLRDALKDGVEMRCADGLIRRVYPIGAAFEGDWPEQCGMACAVQNGCPKCKQQRKGRGEYGHTAPMRMKAEILEALVDWKEHQDDTHLAASGIKPWWPWWADIPYLDFPACIMPDLLHQLHQGLVKSHIIPWVAGSVGKPRMDECFAAMPEAEGMRHFQYGISKVKQWMGRESKEMEKQLLPIVFGQTDSRMAALVRTVLEFTYRASSPQMTDNNIEAMEAALAEFHDLKSVVIDLGLRSKDHFDNIPKLHMLSHYSRCIREMGVPDGYNSESPEHLHIVYTKRGWRASNKVRPRPQMVLFVQRYEAMRIHRAHMNLFYGITSDGAARGKDPSRDNGAGVVYGEDEGGDVVFDEGDADETMDDGSDGDSDEDGLDNQGNQASEQCQHVPHFQPHVTYAQTPAVSRVQGADLIVKYGTSELVSALVKQLDQSRSSSLPSSSFFISPYTEFSVWHRIYLHHNPPPPHPPHRDVIRAKPPPDNSNTRLQRKGTFDVALFVNDPTAVGLHRE